MEVLLHSWAVANMIREGKTHQLDSYLQTASQDGSGNQSLDACIAHHIRNGYIGLEDGLRVANSPDQVRAEVGDLNDA
jgi:Tfp pilus assembly pilus retraction ATPase PilT